MNTKPIQDYIMGVWDGHDSGCAIIRDNQVVVAINEERLSRQKLDVCFPVKSIQACLRFAKLHPADIKHIAVSTFDLSKTLTRICPALKEEYYLIRRKKKKPTGFNFFKKKLKYLLTEIPPSFITEFISKMNLNKNFNNLGFKNYQMHFVNHHVAHAADAAFFSGFEKALVVTIDGIGDGLSGSFWNFDEGKLKCVHKIPGKHSLGIFFEHVTNIMNMRELEDEGKVMALSNFAYPVPDSENSMLDFFQVNDLSLTCRYSSLKLYDELKDIFWKYAPEQFAYMAQRTLEVKVLELIENAMRKTAQQNIAYAGGVASNVKVNLLIQNLSTAKSLFVFPHMGDGGLALGAAAQVNYKLNRVTKYNFDNIYWGQEFSDSEVLESLTKYPHFSVRKSKNVVQEAALVLDQNNIIMWFQGRMEFGPRALGARSILALPNSLNLKDELNLRLKRRVWYQPFCPTILEDDAKKVLENLRTINSYMTTAYKIKKMEQYRLIGVMNIDGSCRPQILSEKDNTLYASLLKKMREVNGFGALLNTSFNLHGEPLVCSPEDALRTFSQTDVHYLILHDWIVTKKSEHRDEK